MIKYSFMESILLHLDEINPKQGSNNYCFFVQNISHWFNRSEPVDALNIYLPMLSLTGKKQ